MRETAHTESLQESSSAVPLADRVSIPPLNELRGSYRVRYASTQKDVELCCRLRYDVFNVELGEGLADSAATGIDRDHFDEQCDHLMVVDESDGQVIGTYRMQTQKAALAGHGFYSAGEFDLSALSSEILGNASELGRAAIHHDHRDRSVLYLLWRGLMAYYRWNDTRYFFGCSSITSQDPEEGLQCHDWLKRKGYLHPKFVTPPREKYICDAPAHETYLGEFPIPRLFGFYLRFATQICSPPALDRDFGTIDFLILTDTRDVVGKLAEAFTRDLPKRR
jgi:putative hemolysin